MLRLVLMLFITAEYASAQISPGELSTPHKNMEGMEFCTQCHTVGKMISNDNCLNCHTEIKSRITAKKGYHASITSKECVECHKEHHGRNFTLIRFNKETFDHAQTGYRLEGKHSALKCAQCHAKGKISDKEVQTFSDARKSSTYLGLGTACLSCHKDEHRGQFKSDCQQCHVMTGWKPASKFSHDKAQFTLNGAHRTVDCSKCHKKTLEHGTVTQFTHLEFGSCRTCHKDPHKGKFKQECAQCHSVESWQKVQTTAFDHNATLFPLKGKHSAMRCEQCHPKNAKERNPNGEFGFHIKRFSACKDCHSDAHGKQFDARQDHGACNACHSEQGFTGSTFTVSDHVNARFVLTGAHRATPCMKCHLDGKVNAKSTKQFHWEGTIACTTCHTDVHKGQFNNRMTKGCETCHTVDAWDAVIFSHDQTKFPLKGKHAALKCIQCHKPQNGTPQYKDVPMNCSNCHEDRHAGQFADGTGTRCERCHTEKQWKALVFDHNSQSRFLLTGKHESVKCEKCHKEALINNIRTIKYKPMEAACVDCHPAQ